MRSSLTSSLTPSAMVWSQPNLPPTRVGPRRFWMRPATLRSSQMKKTALPATKLTRMRQEMTAAMPLAHAWLSPSSHCNRPVRPKYPSIGMAPLWSGNRWALSYGEARRPARTAHGGTSNMRHPLVKAPIVPPQRLSTHRLGAALRLVEEKADGPAHEL